MDFLNWARNQWDRVGAWVCVAAGALLLVIGWVKVSGTPYTSEQIPYVISAGLGGLFLLGVGAMLWISADLRDEWRELHQIRKDINAAPSESPAVHDNGATATTTTEEPAPPPARRARRGTAASRSK